jgi:hypothetical protein
MQSRNPQQQQQQHHHHHHHHHHLSSFGRKAGRQIATNTALEPINEYILEIQITVIIWDLSFKT